MGRYIAGRLAVAIPTLVLLTVVAFGLTTAARGNPAREALRQSGQEPTAAEVAAYRARLGLDDPLPIRYGRWLSGLATGDLGTSFLSGRPVGTVVGDRVGPTLVLGLTAFAIATVLGVGLGLVFGLAPGSAGDQVGRAASVVLASVPSFWLGLLLILWLAERTRLLPVGGSGGWRHLVLPATALAAGQVASLMRLTRSALIEVRRQDYVRTAQAKGLRPAGIALRHALPNAVLPILTLLGLRFGHLLAGAVVVESVFAWPGMGSALVVAIAGRDLPVIGAYVLVAGTAFIGVNLLIDLGYALLDPRVRLGASGRARA